MIQVHMKHSPRSIIFWVIKQLSTNLKTRYHINGMNGIKPEIMILKKGRLQKSTWNLMKMKTQTIL